MQRVDSLENTLMLGKIEGKKRRGQQRMRWLDNITNSLDTNLSKHHDIGEESKQIYINVNRYPYFYWYSYLWVCMYVLNSVRFNYRQFCVHSIVAKLLDSSNTINSWLLFLNNHTHIPPVFPTISNPYH